MDEPLQPEALAEQQQSPAARILPTTPRTKKNYRHRLIVGPVKGPTTGIA